MKTHYLPQFLLKRFVQPSGLHEFDLTTGTIEPRAVLKAGMAENLYTDELETGYLNKIDNDASRVFRKHFPTDRAVTEVNLSDPERLVVSEWMFTLMARIPNAAGKAHEFISSYRADPSVMIQTLQAQDKYGLIKTFQDKYPEAYRQWLEIYGPDGLHEMLLNAVRNAVLNGTLNGVAVDKTRVFSMTINAERATQYVGTFMAMRWMWIVSNFPLIIGDNPLCRWSPLTGRHNWGINQPDVEISMPMTSNVFLLLKHLSTGQHSQRCDEEGGHLMNLRQMVTATRTVYGQRSTLKTCFDNVMEVMAAREDLTTRRY